MNPPIKTVLWNQRALKEEIQRQRSSLFCFVKNAFFHTIHPDSSLPPSSPPSHPPPSFFTRSTAPSCPFREEQASKG